MIYNQAYTYKFQLKTTQVPWWCHYEDGTIPKNKTLCLPSDPDVHFVPQIFGVQGYGARPDQNLEPEIADWEWIYLAYNEPNQPDQSDIPPKIAAQNYKELTEQYPDKGTVRFCQKILMILSYLQTDDHSIFLNLRMS